MSPPPSLLFTAFEPSGDEHASAVIAELRRRHPTLPMHAWGGPRMERAGAAIVERTGDDAVMGLPGYKKIREHSLINDRIAAWMDGNPVTVHIPVDSPAANFPICKLARERGVKVVHLVAPQIWAWGRWRIHKLRRRTNLVLCLLPFEEGFFERRNVPARFVGHPLFDEPLDTVELDRRAAALGEGSPRIALMPGSRPSEFSRSFPLLLETYRALRARYRDAAGVVAATKPSVAERLEDMARRSAGGMPAGLKIVHGDTDGVVRWCELALVVSGTVTLQIAKQLRPMIVFYQTSRLLYNTLARWLVATKFFTLPNVLAHRQVVPELVPYFGGPETLIRAAIDLIDHPEKRQQQREELSRILAQFEGRHAAALAANAIEDVAGLTVTAG